MCDLVRQAQASGDISCLLWVMREIVSGLQAKYRFIGVDIDDVHSQFALVILRKLDSLDTSRNPFSYFTTTALNLLRCAWRVNAREQELRRRMMARAKKPAGRPVRWDDTGRPSGWDVG
jgi:DNA-directed RNA polymerase specialized sigma24 family protein